MAKKNSDNVVARSPIVVVMGHIDHGKSTLLDHIRKTNIVEKEAGSITQQLSAYEVVHKNKDGVERSITFLDTPGHEAFALMRSRGAEIADIAILIVSAEDGVKEQTLEALSAIKEAHIPFIVSINKIDKPGADIERTKNNLLEHEIYLEGLGGNVPYAAISAKTGEGVPQMLDLLLLAVDLEELTGVRSKNAEGVVIESHVDTKKGISATLVIKDGTLKLGMFIVVENSVAPVRIMEDFVGHSIKEAHFSSPVQVTGFNYLPQVGSPFSSFEKKKEAEAKAIANSKKKGEKNNRKQLSREESELFSIPIIIKANVMGAIDAIKHEIEKLKSDRVRIHIIQDGVGTISESDIKNAGGIKHVLILGFNVSVDKQAQDLADRAGIRIKTFSVIYELEAWLKKTIEELTPKIQTEEATGKAKIQKIFSRVKDKQIVGGIVQEGAITIDAHVKILRRNTEIGRGKIINLQSQKTNTQRVTEEHEFGSQIQSKINIAPGDVLESFILVEK